MINPLTPDVLAGLRQYRAYLWRQLEAVDAGIAMLTESVAPVAPAPDMPPPTRVDRLARVEPAADDVNVIDVDIVHKAIEAKVIAVLTRAGEPMRPSDLEAAVGSTGRRGERATRKAVERLERRGLVVRSGRTFSRRVALVPSTAETNPDTPAPPPTTESPRPARPPAPAVAPVQPASLATRVAFSPVSTETARARDEAIVKALRAMPHSYDALVDVLPREPGETADTRRQACTSALQRLRLMKRIALTTNNLWALVRS